MSNKLNQAGETIVEVLLCLAILSMAFAISYQTANQALIKSQNAQEHSTALQLVDSQIELFRTAIQDGETIPAGNFCLNESGGTVNINTNLPSSNCSQQGGSGGVFYSLMDVPKGNSTYDFSVNWTGLGSSGGQQREDIYYRDYSS